MTDLETNVERSWMSWRVSIYLDGLSSSLGKVGSTVDLDTSCQSQTKKFWPPSLPPHLGKVMLSPWKKKSFRVETVKGLCKKVGVQKQETHCKGGGGQGHDEYFYSLYQALIFFNDKYKLNYCKMQFLKKKLSSILVLVKHIYLCI